MILYLYFRKAKQKSKKKKKGVPLALYNIHCSWDLLLAAEPDSGVKKKRSRHDHSQAASASVILKGLL